MTVIGFCRFSFLGRGDWQPGGEVSAEALQESAAQLYAPDRMERRFTTFEKITLPSIAAQTDGDFIFCVISSMAMPLPYQHRLRLLCDPVPNVRLIFSDGHFLGDVMTPMLKDLWDQTDQVVQFRLDDDDAISMRYVEMVKDYSERMKGLSAFAMTFVRGLSYVCYPGEDPWFAEWRQPFQSAAAIIKLAHPDRGVFDVGHFAMQRRYTHIQDVSNFGAFMLKWPSASRVFVREKVADHAGQIDRAAFERACEGTFPHLRDLDFSQLSLIPA